MKPTLDFYWIFLFVPLKTAKQFRSFRRNIFYCERSTKRSRIEESVSKGQPREVAPINWNFAAYTVISVKPCRGGVSPPAGRETRPLRGKTNKTSNSYLLNSAYHKIVILFAYTENEKKPFLSDRQKRFRFWLGNRDSNPNKQSQSLSCYRYTIPQCNSHMGYGYILYTIE